MSEYLFDGEQLNEFAGQLKILKDSIDTTYDSAVSLMNRINDGKWSGKSKDAMSAFMDLVTQYHGKLAGTEGPVSQAADTFEQLGENMGDFYSGYHEYLEMTKV